MATWPPSASRMCGWPRWKRPSASWHPRPFGRRRDPAPHAAGPRRRGYRARNLRGSTRRSRTVGGDYYASSVAAPRGPWRWATFPGQGYAGLPHDDGAACAGAVLAEDPGDLAWFMTRLNKATCAKCPANRFITFFFAVLDAAKGELTFANAGHKSTDRHARVRRIADAGRRRPGAGRSADCALLGAARASGPGRPAGALQRRRHRATNANFDEFGEDRFIEVLRQASA